jgi:multiple sugar transport system permease protein
VNIALVFRRKAVPYVLLAPAILGIGLFQLYPFALGVWYAFTDIQLVSINTYVITGLRNFQIIFGSKSPDFWAQVVANSAVFTAGSILGQMGIGLALAVILQQKWVKGRDVFRVIFLVPWIIAGVIVGYTWRFMYDPRAGLLNTLLWTIGAAPVSWLGTAQMALPALIVANIWRGTGFSLVMQTAGLQSIPDELYDAGLVDGATGWRMLFYITLPLIKPFILIDLIIASMRTINVFDLIYVMTNGGPLYRTEVLPLMMYHQAFDMGYVGRGAAVAAFILMITVTLTIIYFAFFRTEETN